MLAPTAPVMEPLANLLATLKQAWREGASPDAASALRAHPDLLQYPSLAMDLVYEEYCVREAAGSAPEVEEFCQQFPAFQSQIRELLEGHRLLADHPELFDPTTDWPRAGDRFEQLTIVQEVGRGAFAHVYLARDPETGDRLVILKLTPARSGEARTLGPISHPHIVSVLWARQSGAFYAVCMPFVGTVTLRDVLESGFRATPVQPRSAQTFLKLLGAPKLPAPTQPVVPLLGGKESYPEAVAAIASCLADGLGFLHRSGIIHGDLKPSNVLLGFGGHPYLIDFNLSRDVATCPFQCGGTLAYMAPEQLRLLLGGRSEEGPATAGDVYSFGIMLFESLTGRVPFEPLNVPDRKRIATDLLQRQTAARTGPASGHPRIPKSLAVLIDRCLDSNPAQRPPIAWVKRKIDFYLARKVRRLRLFVGAGLVTAAIAIWFAISNTQHATDPVSLTAGAETPTAPRPLTAEDHFARGLRYLKQQDTAPAMKDFTDARRIRAEGPNTAYLAYCYTLAHQHSAASKLYGDAIKDFGFSRAWVHNNRGYSLTQAAPTAIKLS